jgi:hypothetical protein
MFETMTQIGKRYNVDAKEVGKLLYKLKIRDAKHPTQKGFPFDQAITHGIAKLYEGRSGESYYRYNIEPIKEEFERLIQSLPVDNDVKLELASLETNAPIKVQVTIQSKLKTMLSALNKVLESGEIDQLYRLKADIADIYALLPQKVS